MIKEKYEGQKVKVEYEIHNHKPEEMNNTDDEKLKTNMVKVSRGYIIDENDNIIILQDVYNNIITINKSVIYRIVPSHAHSKNNNEM